MAKPPRFIPPGTLVEITARTNAARFHLRPSEQFTACVLGILGRALCLYPVALHAFVMLSNHWHALLTAWNAEMLAGFLQHVHGNVAKASQRVNGVVGKIWAGDASVIPVLDEGAQLARLKYVLSHGTKEGLVQSPLEWPGPTSARVLVGEERLVGSWVDQKARKRLQHAARLDGGAVVAPWKYTERHEIELVALPALEHMSEASRIGVIRELLAEIEGERGGPFLGRQVVLAQDPMARPDEPKRGSAPRAHTTNPELAQRYDELHRAFCETYWKAGERHVTRPTTSAFPNGVFLPAATFVTTSRPASLESMLY